VRFAALSIFICVLTRHSGVTLCSDMGSAETFCAKMAQRFTVLKKLKSSARPRKKRFFSKWAR
jgi:hypothetical protein